MLELRQLRILRAVGRLGSFSAAADEMRYTQSAVSKQIGVLERQLGTPLVERAVRPVRLTYAGRLLVEQAEDALASVSAAEAQVEAIAGLRAGRVEVGCFASAGATFAARAVARFRSRHAGVDVGVSEAGPAELTARTRAGDFDFALSFAYAPEPPGGLERIPLFDDPFAAVLPRDHTLAGRERLHITELSACPWLLPRGEGGQPALVLELMGRACAAAGFEPQVALQVNDCQMVQALVAAGMGIALLPVLALHPVRDDIVVRPVDGAPPPRRIFALRLLNGHRSNAAGELLEEVLRAAALQAPARSDGLPLPF